MLSELPCKPFLPSCLWNIGFSTSQNIVDLETSSTLSVSINTSDVISSFIPHSDKVLYFHLEDHDTSVLRNASYNFGVAHMTFLVPLVSCCLCKQCGSYGKPIYRHHPPTTVTVFTLNGPIPGTKLNLKCHHCGTIYMYGKKHSGCEQF